MKVDEYEYHGRGSAVWDRALADAQRTQADAFWLFNGLECVVTGREDGGRRGYLLRSECAKHFKKLMASTLEEVRKKLEACPDLPALPAAQHSPCVQGSAPQRISAAAAAAGQVGSAGGAAGGEASLFGAAVLNSRGGSCSSSGRKNVFKVKVGGVDSTQPVATLVVPTNSTEEPADQPRRKRRRLDGPPAAGVRGEVQNSPSQEPPEMRNEGRPYVTRVEV